MNALERREFYAEAIRKGDDPLAVIAVAVGDALDMGFRAGWEASGEGHNGEYPDEGKPWPETMGAQEYQNWLDRLDKEAARLA